MEYSNEKLVHSSRLLMEALQEIMKEYKSIADSGDCGWWDAEEQDCYIIAQKAIKDINENELMVQYEKDKRAFLNYGMQRVD